MKNTLSYEILKQYNDVIKAFKNRYDVQNGTRLGYRDGQNPYGNLDIRNKPHSIGEGLTTTGFCVSVSQSLSLDPGFQYILKYRNAKSKLISIDIKEEFWGNCYNGSKNTWHTAILVTDNDINFVIDMTCAQFGNRYVEKFIWDFDTWQKTFRAPNCKHIITDNRDRVLTYSKQTPNNENMFNDSALLSDLEELRHRVNKEVLLTPEEVDMVTEFLFEKINDINIKLLSGTINKFDLSYNNQIIKCLSKMTLKTTDKMYYSVLTFDNKSKMDNFMTFFKDGGFYINHYMIATDKMPDIANLNSREMNDDNTHYVVFEFRPDIECVDLEDIVNGSVLIPYGSECNTESLEIFNGVELLNDSILNTQETNTTYIRV